MSPRRLIVLFISASILLGGSYLVTNRASDLSAVNRVSIGLEDTAAGPQAKTTSDLVEFWQGRVERDPRDYISLAFLGQMFMRRARETGDVADYERAKAAVRKSLALNPAYDVAQSYLSAVLYSEHDFAGALALAHQVYGSNVRAMQSLATIGDSQLELGNYSEAEAAYKTLAEQNPSAPVYSRLARLAWLKGNASEAITYLQSANEEAATLELSGESAAWYQFQLGEMYFNTGQIEQAAKTYSQALGYFDHYYLGLAGLGKVRAAQGKYDEAISLYERAVAIIPQPDLLAALGDLYALTGQPDKAQQQYDTVQFIGKLAAINQVVYNRQLGLFDDNHDQRLAEALDLSTKELSARKDIYGYDAAAWALEKMGRHQEAAHYIEQAMRLGTRDALLYYHAGMIQAGLGDTTRARAMLSEALSINPHFDLLQARIARTTLEQLPAN